MESKKDTQYANILTHPDLPGALDHLELLEGIGTGIKVVFIIRKVKWASGRPGLLWTAQVMVNPLLLDQFCPDFLASENGPHAFEVAARASSSPVGLLEAIGEVVPRVVWHWVPLVVGSEDLIAGEFLRKELAERFPETSTSGRWEWDEFGEF